MVKVKKFIVAYAVIFTACYALMPAICAMVYEERGYFAIGGEWLLPVALIIALESIRQMIVAAIMSVEKNTAEVKEDEKR